MTTLTREALDKGAAEFCADVLRDEIGGVDAGVKLQLTDDGFWATDEERALWREAACALMVELYQRAGVRACRHCGCTDAMGCEDGCTWIEADLCSSCGGKSSIVVVAS